MEKLLEKTSNNFLFDNKQKLCYILLEFKEKGGGNMNNYTIKFKIFLSRLKSGKHFYISSSLDYLSK